MSDRVPHRLGLSALPPPPAQSEAPSPLLVSVDFDFFVAPSARVEMTAPLDWTGDEWWPADEAHRRWQERAAALRAQGVTPAHAMGIVPPEAPARLLAQLRARMQLPAQLFMADSHAYGLLACARLAATQQAPVTVLSFDAHHDLGYVNYDGDSPTRSRARSRASAACDDWLAVALREGYVDSATIVYPEWRGLGEWRFERPTAARRHLRHVRALVWDEWCAQEAAPAVADALLCVRSSEWTPPWGGHDRAYLDFCASLATERICLDCDPTLHRVGGQNACHVRAEV